MKGILNFLARAKLVELSEDERLAATEAETHTAGASAIAGADAAPGRMQEESVDVSPVAPRAVATAPSDPLAGEAEGIALADIFAAAGVPDSPYPAELLLRLLDGLRAMDAGTRKAAVLAMDAADDNWQIGDCIADADRKISALDAYKQQLNAQLQDREQQSAEVVNQIKLAIESSTAAIRKQIA